MKVRKMLSKSGREWVGLCLLLVLTVFVNGSSSAVRRSSNEVYDDHDDIDNTVFDYIVVGGGTGGCAVAARLAESPRQYSVLLIESGGYPDEDQEVPGLLGQFLGDEKRVYKHVTVPQGNAGLGSGGIIRFVTGRGLGGSSSVNGMFFNRGNPHDYNLWARIVRDPSWNYTNMLPYFKKIETYAGGYGDDSQHGYHGPITVSRPMYAPAASEWLQAGRELGLSGGDPNGPQGLGFTSVEFAKRFGRRVSSYTGYLEPLMRKNRKNLRVVVDTDVSRVIFNGSRAVGVEFRHSNASVNGYVYAGKEVIVTAGVIGTPTLLMRSGVGPRSILDKAGIKVIRNLSVGKYLHDQVGVQLPVILGNSSAVFDSDRDLDDGSWDVFNQFGDGPYSSSIGASGQAFLASSVLPPSEKLRGWGDIHLLGFSTPNLVGKRNSSELRDGEVYASWTANVGRPKSRGSVRLNGSDIDGLPVIDFNYLDHPIDLQVAVDGVKWIVRVCEETNGFRRLGCRLGQPLKECDKFKFRSEEYWRCYVRRVGRAGLHPVGSCPMGAGWDNLGAVVDSRLRVIGTTGLRLADASVMPAIVNSNTMVAVYAIAERAAEMILNDAEILTLVEEMGTSTSTMPPSINGVDDDVADPQAELEKQIFHFKKNDVPVSAKKSRYLVRIKA